MRTLGRVVLTFVAHARLARPPFAMSMFTDGNGNFPRDKTLVMDCKKLQKQLEPTQRKLSHALEQFDVDYARSVRAVDDAAGSSAAAETASLRDALLAKLGREGLAQKLALRDQKRALDEWLEMAEVARDAAEWAIVAVDASEMGDASGAEDAGARFVSSEASRRLAKIVAEADGGAKFALDEATLRAPRADLKGLAPPKQAPAGGAGTAPAYASRGRSLSSPSGVAVDAAGNVLVYADGAVRVLREHGFFAPLFFGKFGSGPCVAVNVWPDTVNFGDIVVVKRDKGTVHVFDGSGAVKLTFGANGAGEGEFNMPAGVAVDRLGQIVVADFYNDRVQVFTGDGAFVRAFGSKGAQDGQLRMPRSVAVLPDGAVAVSEQRNERVSVFEQDGQFRSSFKLKDLEPDFPMYSAPDLAVDRDGHLILSNHEQGRLLLVTQDGTFLKAFGADQLGEDSKPNNIAVDAEGKVFVSCAGTGRVVMIDAADAAAGGQASRADAEGACDD